MNYKEVAGTEVGQPHEYSMDIEIKAGERSNAISITNNNNQKQQSCFI